MLTPIERILSDIHLAEELGYTVFGAFLYGSQNYGVDTSNSDIDTRVVVYPKLDTLLYRRPMEAETIEVENGAAHLTDIREWASSLKKGGVNFVEQLFTSHYAVTDEDALIQLKSRRADIAYYDSCGAMRAWKGYFYNAYDRFYKPTEKTQPRFDTYGYNNKALADAVRILAATGCYSAGVPYSQVIYLPQAIRSECLKLKTDPEMSVEEATTYMEHMKELMDTLCITHITLNGDEEPNREVGEYVDKWLRDQLIKYIRKEIDK